MIVSRANNITFIVDSGIVVFVESIVGKVCETDFHMDKSREFSAVFLLNPVICLPDSADRL
jgi:hypothetical protein